MSVDYDIRCSTYSEVEHLFREFHGYGTVTKVNVYCYAVFEDDEPVAAYTWGPPPIGAAKSACPEFIQGVLALTRMVAVPKAQRRLNHVSRPLRHQMKHLIDRTRYPVLITYVDYGQGHTGHAYRCSGWQRTGISRKRNVYHDSNGVRVSDLRGGKPRKDKVKVGTTEIERWEHRITDGDAWEYAQLHGWVKEPVPGKVWKSGNQAYRYVNKNT